MKVLEIQNLKKIYQDQTEALSDVSFSVEQGEFFSLLGLNGAGKTTLIGIMNNLVSKTSGQIKVMGIDMDTDMAKVKSMIGLVPQEFNFNVFLTVKEVLMNYAGYYGMNRQSASLRLDTVLNEVKLSHKAQTQIRFLSGGMKRRVMIARALMHSPTLLFLDEPTAGVDVDLRREIWDLLKSLNRNGMSIILTSHYMEEVEHLCQRVAILHQGRIVRVGSVSAIQEMLSVTQYALTLNRPFQQTIDLPGIEIESIEGKVLHVLVERSLHQLLVHLTQQGYEVDHVDMKTNRLESYFLADVQE
ncbi:ABC transporter ATP-binding protein [Gammaproteobacteria bacterium]|nr:ABC transporter ATP-binding protein [Gammaproteobacteria bacterium]